MSKKPGRKGHKTSNKSATARSIMNRRAGFDYELSDDLVVGLELTGAEVKAARLGRVQLVGSYVTSRENPQTKRTELFLINAPFSLQNSAPKNSDGKTTVVDTRSRKILAKRKQIDELAMARQRGKTILPTKLLVNGKYIKLVIALGKGKKSYDKRESIKRKDLARENARFLKKI